MRHMQTEIAEKRFTGDQEEITTPLALLFAARLYARRISCSISQTRPHDVWGCEKVSSDNDDTCT